MFHRYSMVLPGVFFVAGALFAADSWASKPFTEWSDKDVQKVVSNSPWAHVVSVSLNSGGGGGAGGRGGRGRGGGGAGDVSGSSSQMENPASGGTGSGRRTGSGSGMPDDTTPAVGSTPSANVLVRWQSALPVKQALVRGKFGAEAASSEEAKKFLEKDEPYYVIAIIGAPRMGGSDQLTGMIKASTTLRRKGKDPISPEKVEVLNGDSGAGPTMFLMFPKTDPIVLDDKDVELSMKLQMVEVRQRFRLKDMVIGDKLAL